MPEPTTTRSKHLRRHGITDKVIMDPAMWRVALAVLTSAQTMMESSVHSTATSNVIREIASQTGIEVTPVKVGEE